MAVHTPWCDREATHDPCEDRMATHDPDKFHFEDWQDEKEMRDFRKDAISEIERYRRIDEWISSYHNVFSTTALKSA